MTGEAHHVGDAGREITSQLGDEPDLSDSVLVNFLAFWLDLSPIEKQALLEVAGHHRARRLLEILEFQRHVASSGHGNPSGQRMH